MKITLRYFASIREAIGTGSEAHTTPARNLGELRAELVARGGVYAQALASGRSLRMALNQTMSEESAVLQEGCEVAFFPPVTGG